MTGHTDTGRWTEAEDLRLRELWRTGHTAAQSAQILSDESGREITRSAVLGRLYRMGLSKPRVRTVPAPVEDGKAEDGKPDDGRTEGGGSAVRRALGMDGRIIPPPKTCQWPHGQPGTDGFHFCGSDQVVPGKPYCADHCRVAYRQPRDASAEGPAEDRAEHRVGDAA
ncbi:MAG: GcrA family cell cycle regulator [Alphaproteobacteria bacterium]|nr:GcrA family cell cycle regulator [Alphaproteobacteria bacterium]